MPVRALGEQIALFVDRQVEIGDRARASGDLRDRRNRFQAVTAVLVFLDFDRGDDRRGDRAAQVGVDEDGRLPTLDAAVEEEQLALDRDRRLFGEFDLDAGRAFADDRLLAGFFGGLRRRRFDLALLTGRDALGADAAVPVRFED